MRKLIVITALAITGLTLAPAEATTPTRPWFENHACSTTRATNCHLDANLTKQPDYSFYRVQIDGKTCTIYWDRALRGSNYCR